MRDSPNRRRHLSPWVRCRSTTWSSSVPARVGRRRPSRPPSWANRWRWSNGQDARRGVRQHRHHSVEDVARGRRLSHGMSQRELYGASYRVKEKITPADLLARTQHVITKEVDVVRSQLMRNRVELYVGHARFVDEHTIPSRTRPRRDRSRSAAKFIVIATGTKPLRPRASSSTEPGARLRRNPRSEEHSRPPWSSWAPESSASSTPRCSPRSAPR